MRVLIRADATRRWGLGHLARCSALALALRRAGHAVSFACRDDGSGIAAARLAGHGFDHLPLMQLEDEESDARETLLLARAVNADRIVVDHYGLGESWWRAVAAERALVAIDDLGRAGMGACCDAVLNQNVGARADSYPGGATLLIGPRYVLLPDDILPRRVAREHVLGPMLELMPRRVLLTVGGSDPLGMMPRLMRAAASVATLDRIDVAIGPGFGDTSRLDAMASADGRIVLHRRLSSLLNLLMESDAVITAGGTTTYEAACLGVPMALVQVADNQAGIVRGMEAEGAAVFLGEAAAFSDEALAGGVASFLGDSEGLLRRARRGMRLVDGLGAMRVAEALTASPSGNQPR